ncbi:MAG: hypothetical protein LBK57_11390 [Clostridiales Family XIII bacterium]|nr:hypothetical protein [Clostridiales Family XIII bacterium]
MSFAIAACFKDYAIIAADTRSTTSYPNGERKHDDGYKKIACIPNTNIVTYSTGVNMFAGKNFEQIASEITADNAIAVCLEFASHIKPTLCGNDKTYVTAVEYRGNTLFLAECDITSSTFNINQTAIDPSKMGEGGWRSFYSGPDWARNLTASVDFTGYIVSQREAIVALRNYIKGLILISPLMKESRGAIGGNVDMVLLKPESAPEFLTFL